MSAPRPVVLPPTDYVFPVPEVLTLGNGLDTRVYDLPGQQVVSVRVSLPLPLTAEPRELEGIATIMARLLDEGTAQHTPEEFAELLERHGVALGAGMNDRGLGVDLDVPRRHLGQALELLRQALAEPDFPEAEVQRAVRSRLAQIEQERALPGPRAAREFIATFFAPQERASRPTSGRAETVSAIDRASLRDFHARHVGPAGGTVVIAGDLAGLDVPALLAQTVGAWIAGPRQEPDRPSRPPRQAPDRQRIVIVDRPGAVQSELYVGCPGPDRAVAGGWAPYPVLGYVVGGSPTARVDQVLREERGYTYGLRSGFRPRAVGGLFVTGGSVRAEVTAEALGLLLDILDGARDGFTAQELTAGVDFVTRTAPARYATADAVADEAVALAMDGLPDDFPTTVLARTRELALDDLREAYAGHVQGDWTVVLVADAAAHADAIRGLDRGEVAVVPA